MREILHKAKVVSTDKKWIEGYYVKQQNVHLMYLSEFDDDGKFVHRIYKDTVCRYIGIDDYKNVKIFENDYIKTGEGDLWRVFWDEELLQYRFKCFKNTYSFMVGVSCDIESLPYGGVFEVVGNYYDDLGE